MSDAQIVDLMIGLFYAVPLLLAAYLVSWVLGCFESAGTRRLRRSRRRYAQRVAQRRFNRLY